MNFSRSVLDETGGPQELADGTIVQSSAAFRALVDEVLPTISVAEVENLISAAEGLAKRIAARSDKDITAAEHREIASFAGCLGKYSDNDNVLYACLLHFGVEMSSAVADQLIFWIRWGQCGMPSLLLTEKQFASFSISDVDRALLLDWRLPWPAINVPVPGGILAVGGVPVSRIMCHRKATQYSVPDNAAYVFRLQMGTAEIVASVHQNTLADAIDPDRIDRITYNTLPQEPGDGMVRKLGVSAIINAISFINNGYKIEEVVLRTKTRRKAKLAKLGRSYTLNVPVKIDVVKHVRNYVNGTNTERLFTMRWLVRGHRKNQAYGLNRTLRKSLWIEPYWKGPEAALVKRKNYTIG
jgi:hypothetical protein